MPLTSEDVLNKLVEATAEAKETTKKLHEARAAAMDVIKNQRKHVEATLTDAVNVAVERITNEMRALMRLKAEGVIDEFARDLRAKMAL